MMFLGVKISERSEVLIGPDPVERYRPMTSQDNAEDSRRSILVHHPSLDCHHRVVIPLTTDCSPAVAEHCDQTGDSVGPQRVRPISTLSQTPILFYRPICKIILNSVGTQRKTDTWNVHYR